LNSLSTQRDVNAGFADWARFAVGVAMAVALTGCAAVKPRTAEEVVRERAQARWDALVRGDTKAAYEFFSSGSRSVLKPEDFANSIRVGFWKSAVVDEVVCAQQELCEAHVTIEYEFQGVRVKAKKPLVETWIRAGTDWWFVHK
jgi:hypothetical protein